MDNNINEKLINFIEQNNINIISEDKITKLNKIGEGSFGKVYKGVYGDIFVAIKKLRLQNIDNSEVIIQEIKGVGKITHPQIPRFHGIWKTQKRLHLIFDYIDGDTLTKFIPDLSYEEKLNISIQLVEIIEKLHEENLIHRDLKPGNIMIMKGKVYIIDFGVSKIASHTLTYTKSQSGTIPYMGPENYKVNLGQNQDPSKIINISTKFDIWSLGCILSYLFTKVPPWGDKASDTSIIMKLSSGKKFPIPHNILPKEFEDVLKMCLEVNVENRISAKDLCVKLKELAANVKK